MIRIGSPGAVGALSSARCAPQSRCAVLDADALNQMRVKVRSVLVVVSTARQRDETTAERAGHDVFLGDNVFEGHVGRDRKRTDASRTPELAASARHVTREVIEIAMDQRP
jgi:hypothetical protein